MQKPKFLNIFKNYFYLTVTLFAFGGCASNFETAKFNDKNWTIQSQPIEGIVYYEPHQVLVTHEYTAFADQNNNLNQNCKRVIQKQELLIEANFSDPRIIMNKPAIFSTNKFSVEFLNGMLKSVNSESAPTLPALLTGAGSFIKDSGIGVLQQDGNTVPLCNTSPLITSKKPYLN